MIDQGYNRQETISSVANPKIKELLSLRDKAKERKERALFIIEGEREIRRALEYGYRVKTLFYNPNIIEICTIGTMTADQYIEVTDYLYEKIAYRGTTEGVLAIVHEKRMELNNLQLSKNPFIIVLESIEKPGNLGAILRTADAIRADAVLICDAHTDIYNPNVVRSSLGGIFTNQIVSCSSQEAYTFLEKHNISIITTELESSSLYYDVNFTKPCAIIMGSEADGLSDLWKRVADRRIKIPMRGVIDSLNVSVSTAVVAFEVLRQRDLNQK